MDARRPSAGLVIEPFVPTDDLPRARRLWELQRESYRVEARLLGTDAIPPLRESFEELLSAKVRWVCASMRGELLGALAWTTEDGGVYAIDRLVVSPASFRQGTGHALVSEAVRIAEPHRVAVSTGLLNSPARALYESLGFEHVSDAEVEPELWISNYVLDNRDTRARSNEPVG